MPLWAEARLFVGGVRGQPGQVVLEVVDVALRGRSHHAGQHPNGATAVEAVARQGAAPVQTMAAADPSEIDEHIGNVSG